MRNFASNFPGFNSLKLKPAKYFHDFDKFNSVTVGVT